MADRSCLFDAASGAGTWSYGLSGGGRASVSGHSYSDHGRGHRHVGTSGTSGSVNFTYYAAPTVTTGAASAISTTAATLNGSVNAQGDTDTVVFRLLDDVVARDELVVPWHTHCSQPATASGSSALLRASS